MKTNSIAYTEFLQTFKTKTSELLKTEYPELFELAGKNMLKFPAGYSQHIVRWHNASLLNLLNKAELRILVARIQDKLLPAALAALKESIDLDGLKERMVSLLIECILSGSKPAQRTGKTLGRGPKTV